ncbi:disease resistance protein Roq1-like [Cryptomeria japonica]|uniref:disease resistance protein Roq1-like n=1 Tax=Cryptomeria japonica TaxID=3369 RepID=UPI0027DA51CA|nr:disease resistance protein Roq1-like [Cryptomeria japonica]
MGKHRKGTRTVLPDALKKCGLMECAGLKPESAIFSIFLLACAKMGALELDIDIHLRKTNGGIFSVVVAATALADVYLKKSVRCSLVQDSLNSGSLVIVTTRDEGLLTSAGISSHYKLKEMKRGHATELFCRHALGLAKAPPGYDKLLNSFVDFCGGLPLAIQVSAANLFGITDIVIWHSELQKFERSLNLEIIKKQLE